MAGTNPVLEAGPDTWPVSVPITGGQLVMIDPADTAKKKIAPTDGAVPNCLGQAAIDALPKGDMGTNMARLRDHVSVRYAPYDVEVTYLNSASPGDPLVTASDGRVQRYDDAAGHTPDLIVARCTEPGGATAGAIGRVRLL
jgi:hypothetical protein